MSENLISLDEYRKRIRPEKTSPEKQKPETANKPNKSAEIESVFGSMVAKAYEQSLREAKDATKITQIIYRMQALLRDTDDQMDDGMLGLVENLLRAD